MRKSDYDSIYKKIYKNKSETEPGNEIFSYREIKEFFDNMGNLKPRNKIIYKKEREIAQLYAISIGFIALAIYLSDDDIKEEYKHDSTVYFSLLTNISNDILGIVTLVDNGFEFQAKILFRNLMELVYTFLIMIINNQKRKEYFDSGRLENAYAIWQKNLKMSKLNEELSNYENIVFDDELQKEMKEKRTELYKYYSSFVHNDFIYTFISCFSFNKKTEDLNYNLWGTYNYGGKDILESLNILIWIYLMYFKNIIAKTDYFNRNNYITKENFIYWNSGFMILLMLENELKRIMKNKDE